MESSSACRLPAFGRAGLPLIFNYFKYLDRPSPSFPVLGVQNFGLLCPSLPRLCQKLCGTFQKPLIFEALRLHEKQPSVMAPQRRAGLFVPRNISAYKHPIRAPKRLAHPPGVWLFPWCQLANGPRRTLSLPFSPMTVLPRIPQPCTFLLRKLSFAGS
jgi:hypothetical protein